MSSTRQHENNFGLLRIIFATSVIFTHSFYFVDGNSSREPFVRMFHVLSIADMAVDGFFIISGYLVAKSYFQSRSRAEYIGKRVLRIYPGYIAACAFSLLIAVFTGGSLPHIGVQSASLSAVELVSLTGVHVDHAFANLPYPGIANGSLWSVAYEFRCYLLLVVLGAVGLFRNKEIVGVLTVGLLVCLAFVGPGTENPGGWWLAALDTNVRASALFLTGTMFFLFENRIRYSALLAGLAVAALLVLLPFAYLATPALAIFGGYAILWFALRAPTSVLSRAANQVDLSYGVYLYAWPIGELLIWCFRIRSASLAFGATTLLAYLVAWLSWTLLEKPALGLKQFLTPERGF